MARIDASEVGCNPRECEPVEEKLWRMANDENEEIRKINAELRKEIEELKRAIINLVLKLH